jgi:hypothetical protein
MGAIVGRVIRFPHERFVHERLAALLSVVGYGVSLNPITGGPANFTAKDRQAFANQLDRWLTAAKD